MNTITKVSFFFLLLVSSNSFCQHSFPDLKYTSVIKSSLGSKFGYLESLNFKLINKFCIDEERCYGFERDERLLGTLQLNNNQQIDFYYCEGPSADPTFYAVLNDEIIFKEFGKTLHLKGKTLYIEGKANSYFDKKRKFVYQNGQYNETIQPFYYIGIKGKLNHSIVIYQNEELINKVATLPIGYEIEIIGGKINTENQTLNKVLVKTKFGLLGWVNFNPFDLENPLLDNFRYSGD